LKTGFFSSLLALVLFCAGASCSSKPVRNINAVLADHTTTLMAEPGVVGVYVGLLPDEKTPCLKVMIKDRDSAVHANIPKEIEGYRVVREVTGEIRALKDPATRS
jgi:hypothetical protein